MTNSPLGDELHGVIAVLRDRIAEVGQATVADGATRALATRAAQLCRGTEDWGQYDLEESFVLDREGETHVIEMAMHGISRADRVEIDDISVTCGDPEYHQPDRVAPRVAEPTAAEEVFAPDDDDDEVFSRRVGRGPVMHFDMSRASDEIARSQPPPGGAVGTAATSWRGIPVGRRSLRWEDTAQLLRALLVVGGDSGFPGLIVTHTASSSVGYSVRAFGQVRTRVGGIPADVRPVIGEALEQWRGEIRAWVRIKRGQVHHELVWTGREGGRSACGREWPPEDVIETHADPAPSGVRLCKSCLSCTLPVPTPSPRRR